MGLGVKTGTVENKLEGSKRRPALHRDAGQEREKGEGGQAEGPRGWQENISGMELKSEMYREKTQGLAGIQW